MCFVLYFHCEKEMNERKVVNAKEINTLHPRSGSGKQKGFVSVHGCAFIAV